MSADAQPRSDPYESVVAEESPARSRPLAARVLSGRGPMDALVCVAGSSHIAADGRRVVDRKAHTG